MAIFQPTISGGGGSAPAHYIPCDVDANGKLIKSSNMINLSGVNDLGYKVLDLAYTNVVFPQNTVFDMSTLTKVSGSSACEAMCSASQGIVAVNFSGLTTVSGGNAFYSAFYSCIGITSINFNSLTTVSGNNAFNTAFQGCTGIISVNLPNLTTISGQYGMSSMFNWDTGITNVSLPSLTNLSGRWAMTGTFYGCTNLTSLSFPSITTTSFGSYNEQFNSMCKSIPDITLHFPSNVQSVIEGLQGYSTTAPFGATSGTVLFDLPATNTLTGADTVTYTRNPKYDTGTALAWKVGAYGTTDFTPAYYTSGLTDPTVGTTIYSDSACTIAVTTVDSIA